MEVKKGQLLEIRHWHHGVFVAEASVDFDTEAAENWPVVVAEASPRETLSDLVLGEYISCRARQVAGFELL